MVARTIMRDDPEAMSPWGTLGIMGCLSWYFLFALGGAGQPPADASAGFKSVISHIALTDVKTDIGVAKVAVGRKCGIW